MKLDFNHGCVKTKMGMVYTFESKEISHIKIKWCEYCNEVEIVEN